MQNLRENPEKAQKDGQGMGKWSRGLCCIPSPWAPAMPLQTGHLLWNTETGSVPLEAPKQRHIFPGQPFAKTPRTPKLMSEHLAEWNCLGRTMRFGFVEGSPSQGQVFEVLKAPESFTMCSFSPFPT